MRRLPKAGLRKRIKARRQALDTKQVDAWSETITKRCLELIEWSQVKSLHSYIPITNLHEVDTWPLLREIWQHWPNIKVAAPRLGKNGQLESVVVNAKTKWKEHVRGIPQPVKGEVLP